jgi:hypothetical protein
VQEDKSQAVSCSLATLRDVEFVCGDDYVERNFDISSSSWRFPLNSTPHFEAVLLGAEISPGADARNSLLLGKRSRSREPMEEQTNVYFEILLTPRQSNQEILDLSSTGVFQSLGRGELLSPGNTVERGSSDLKGRRYPMSLRKSDT